MSETPDAPGIEPKRLVPGLPSAPGAPPAGRERSRWKKIRAPLILVASGLGLLLVAFILYPSIAQVSSPDITQIVIISNINSDINYQVFQVSTGVAEVEVTLKAASVPLAGGTALVQVTPPTGTTIVDCQHPDCDEGQWVVNLRFTANNWSATTHFLVNARSFGVNYDSVTAAVAIPEIILLGNSGPVLQTLSVNYNLPSASSYDWSSYPTSAVDNSQALWIETMASSDTPGRAVVGINHAAQSNDDTRIFIAGALLGLAGGALLSGVQEALHAND